MMIDAHFYALLAFARACGFNKETAYQTAHASQFVDDAKINLMYLNEDPGCEHDVIDGHHLFLNMATCHTYTRLKTFNYDAMINNTCAFHFVPGCEGEKFPEKLRCKEGSDTIKSILYNTLEKPDPITLGIVLHAYADTFSHQDFSGLLSKVNDIQDCRNVSPLPWDWRDKVYKPFKFFVNLTKKDMMDKLLDKGIPAYGHGQAAWYPDLPYLTWSYTYDPSHKFSIAQNNKPKIENPLRFKRAFQNIKMHLDTFLKKHPKFKDPAIHFQEFGILFDTLTEKNHTRNRIKKWKNLMVQYKFFEENELNGKSEAGFDYDENRWLKEAFENFDR